MSTETKPWPIQRLLWPTLLALEVAGTLWLACRRIYQVDEAQTVYMASVLARGWKDSLFTSGQLHLFPLSLLVRSGWSSSQIFIAFRLAFWALSWVNAGLLVLAAGIPLRRKEGLKALVIAGSLAPWWAYALECRHDNILILSVLLLWILGRRVETKSRAAVFFGLGALSLLLQACLFKSIVTWAPLSVLLLLAERTPWRRKAWLAGAWILGAVAATSFAYGVRAWAGLLGNINEGAGALGGAMAIDRFSPLPTLGRLLEHAPLLAAAMAVLVFHAFRILRERGFKQALEAQGGPEIGLFFVGVLAFLINPTPFPYNLAVLSGMAMVALLTLGVPWLVGDASTTGPAARYVIVAALVLHVLPLARRFTELASMGNEQQESIMSLAEAMTGPEDPVFDAIGLVPTRRAPSFMWLINLTNVKGFTQTSMTRFWGAEVPPVIIPSYRFAYLKPEDGEFIQSQYVPIRRDFYVLGAALTQPGTKRPWTCRRAGRYAVVPVGGSAKGVRVDGQILAPGFHDLASGDHDLEVLPDSPCLLVWAGPNLRTYPDCRPDQGMASACPVPTQM